MEITLDAKVTAALIGIVGIFITIIGSLVAYYYQQNKESNRAAREVLFYLLEIRYFIHTSMVNIDELTTAYLKFFVQRAKRQDVELKLENLDIPPHNVQLKKHLLNVVNHIKPDLDEKILDNYEKSLQNLSSDYPILAYRLKGRNKLDSILEETHNHLDIMKKSVIGTPEENVFTSKNNNFFDDVLSKSKDMGLAMLNEDILLLAGHCGAKTTRECKELLNTQLISNYDNLLQKSETEVDELISLMKKNIKEHQLAS